MNETRLYGYGTAVEIAAITKIRGLNKGKGYSGSLVRMVITGKRNNPEVMEIFNEYIEAINKLKNA